MQAFGSQGLRVPLHPIHCWWKQSPDYTYGYIQTDSQIGTKLQESQSQCLTLPSSHHEALHLQLGDTADLYLCLLRSPQPMAACGWLAQGVQ